MLFRAIRALFTGVFNLIEGVLAFFTSQWKQFNPIGQALFAAAVVMIAVDATISFKFGLTQTWVHAIGFAGLAVVLFLLPDAAITEWRKGNKGGSIGLGIACLPIAAVCLWTHVGYSSGVRLGDIEQDGYSKVAYANAGTALQDKRKTLAMLQEKHKTILEKQADALTRNKGWTVAVDPVAMKSTLDAMDLKIANETARGGCKTKCEGLKVERGNLSAAIALAKEENDLAEQVAILEKEIGSKASEVAALAPKGSATVSQVQMAAKLVNVAAYYSGAGTAEQVLNPSAFQQDIANTAAAGISSVAFLIAGATTLVGAGFNRLHGAIHGEPTRAATSFPAPTPTRAPTAPFASSPSVAPPAAAGKALAGVIDRRDRVAAVIAMRQSRVDGALLKAA